MKRNDLDFYLYVIYNATENQYHTGGNLERGTGEIKNGFFYKNITVAENIIKKLQSPCPQNKYKIIEITCSPTAHDINLTR